MERVPDPVLDFPPTDLWPEAMEMGFFFPGRGLPTESGAPCSISISGDGGLVEAPTILQRKHPIRSSIKEPDTLVCLGPELACFPHVEPFIFGIASSLNLLKNLNHQIRTSWSSVHTPVSLTETFRYTARIH